VHNFCLRRLQLQVSEGRTTWAVISFQLSMAAAAEMNAQDFFLVLTGVHRRLCVAKDAVRGLLGGAREGEKNCCDAVHAQSHWL